jgi:LysR family transcriptional regulator, nitrogen assimilation regulatory protein
MLAWRKIALMELRSLGYFVRIAELGSITRAAAHLHLAQPALTRHVQRLEEELGVTLFTRANRGVRLTEAGEKLLDSATRILRDVERTGDEIRAHDAAHPSGRIILGITPTLCPVLVPEIFQHIRQDFPRVDLKVMHAGMIRLEEFVIDGRVDIALLSELSRSRLVVSTPLAREEMVLVTRPEARPAGGIVDRAELGATPLVLGDGLRAAMDALLAGSGIELRVEIEINDHETMRLMVQQGVAASILPYSSVARECAAGLVAAHRLTEDGIFRTLALGVRVSRGASLARDAVGRTIAAAVAAMEEGGRLALHQPAPRRAGLRIKSGQPAERRRA